MALLRLRNMPWGSIIPRIRQFFLTLALAVLCVASLSTITAAEEASTQSWKIVRADCQYLLQDHEMVEAAGRQSKSAEYLRIRAGAGTYLDVEQAVERSRIIDDLVAGVWLRSDRKGLQVFAKVVLPNTPDPKTGQSATMRLAGNHYENIGDWQFLKVANTTAILERQLPVLRARLRAPVDTRGAYLESLIVNVFGGPGTTRVWLDEIELQGNIHIVQTSLPHQSKNQDSESATGSGPRLRSSKLTIDDRPFFPRIVDHHGEPLELLKKLGFNTVYLSEFPSEQLHAEAVEQDIRLICPAPHHVEDIPELPAVAAWHLGDDISGKAGIREYTETLRRNDPRSRLIIGGAIEDQWQASRQVDVLLRTRAPIGTSFPLSEFDEWLHQTSHLVRPGTPIWCSIQTELAPTLIQQAQSLSNQRENFSSVVEMEQMRQLSLAALSAGSRGLWFRTQRRMDGDRYQARRLRQILERLNIELALMSPWVMGGQRMGSIDSNNPDRQVVSLATERSRLLITTSTADDSQFVGAIPRGTDTMVVAGVPDSTDVYLLSPVGLRPVQRRRISGGIQIQVDANSADSLMLMTEDPLVVTHINRLVTQTRARAAILEYQIAREDHEQLLEATKSSETTAWSQLIDESQQSLAICQRLLESGDITDVYRFARQAVQAQSQLRRLQWKTAINDQPHPLSHPAGGAFQLVSNHEQISFDDAEARPWPGGDCEDLREMLQTGWRQHQTSPEDLETYIALSPNRVHGGRHSLRIQVNPLSKQAAASVIETPPIWVNSSPITVYPGQRVRIRGWIRIDETIRGSVDGLVIYDSIGGEELGQRFQRTRGWQQFEMIRAINQHDHLTLSFALSGLGEVWIDDLEVAVSLDKRRLVSQN